MHGSIRQKLSLLALAVLLQLLSNRSFASILLHEGIEYLEDKSNQLRLDDIQKLPQDAFRINGSVAPNFKFTSSSIWFRFQIPAGLESEDSLALVVNYSHIDEIDLFIPKPDGSYVMRTVGRNFPFQSRELKIKDLAFRIKPSEILRGRPYYLHSRTTSSAQFPMEIMTFQEFFENDMKRSMGVMLYTGAMLIMAFYNFIFFLTTRRIAYGVYTLFTISACVLVLSVMGIGFQYLWPQSVSFNKVAQPLLIGINIILMTAFCMLSLPRVREFPRCHLQLRALLFLGIGLACICPFFSYQLVVKITIVTVLITTLSLFGVITFLTVKGDRAALFFFISFAALIGGTIVFALKTVGITSSHVLIDNGPLIGSAMQVALLTLALADQFREIKKQKEMMQAQMIALQEQNIQNLDREVEAKTRDIRSILGTINQGIFTFSGFPASIDPEFSRQMHHIFPGQKLVGEDPINLLFDRSDFSADQIAQIRSALEFSIDQDMLSFDINSASLPRHIRLHREALDLHYELDWNPVINGDQSIDKILVAIRDVSAMKSLEATSRQNRQELELIQKIIAIPYNRFSIFLQGLQDMMSRIREEPADTQRIKSFLHTIKGNARTFDFTAVATAAHELEDLIKSSSELPVEWNTRLQTLDACIESLVNICEVKLGRSLQHRSFQCTLAEIDPIIGLLREVNATPIPQETRLRIQSAQRGLYSLAYETLPSILEDIIGASKQIAQKTGKIPPHVIIRQQGDLYVAAEFQDALISIFTHLLTNSVDHGLESPADRTTRGKDPRGTITLEIQQDDQSGLRIRLYDDGRGLNLRSIRERALAKGVLAAAETDPMKIARTIFSSGVSTARTISAISGRGVGLNAVEQMLQDRGGTIALEFMQPVDAAAEQVAFAFLITFPLNLLKQVS